MVKKISWSFEKIWLSVEIHPSKHLFVLKTSWRCIQDMSWRHLHHVSSVTILRLPRRLEDILQRCLEDVLKTSWRRLGRLKIVTLKTSWRRLEDMPWRRLEDMSWRHVLKTSWRHVLKMSWRHILKTSWRHYGEKQNTYRGYLCLTNLNVYLANLYLTNLYLTILRWIQNALIRTQ